MNKWLKILLWVVLFSGVVAILIWEQSEESSADIKMPLIQITVTGQDTFLTQDEVINRLQTQQIFDPQGSVGDLDIALAEAVLDTMPEIKHADVYKHLNGLWHIDLELIKPIARVFPEGHASFYLDTDGNKMRRSSIHTARTLIFSGNIPDRITTENVNSIINNDSLKSIRLLDDIYRISNYVCKDPLLQSLIGQVYFDENKDFILIPVLGRQKIVFGTAETIEEVSDKFNRLKVFYKEAMPFEGWNKYSEISLKYEGQVVCRKFS